MFPSWSAAISFVRTGVFSFHRGHNVISVARIGVFIFPSWSQRDLSRRADRGVYLPIVVTA